METPDITRIQKLVAVWQSVVGALLMGLVSFDLITTEQMVVVGGFFAALGSALVVSDAIIRNGRSRVLTNVEAMKEMERPAAPYVNH